jgi:hypothetical protein
VISGATGLFAPATFGFLNVVEFLGGSFLAGRAIQGVSDAADGIPAVAQLRKDTLGNPLQAQVGEMLPAVVTAGASARNLIERGGGVLTEAMGPYVEGALEATLRQMGVKPEEVQPATLESIVKSAAWGALLSGVGGREASKTAVEEAPPEILEMANQSPELVAMHPEIKDVLRRIRRLLETSRITPRATTHQRPQGTTLQRRILQSR